MKVCFNGIGQQVVTFANGGTAAKGKICKISTNGTVANCSNGDSFAGMVLNTDGSWADVQLKGYMTVPYIGTAPGFGWQALVANGSGGVLAREGGQLCLVAEVNTTAKTIGIFI